MRARTDDLQAAERQLLDDVETEGLHVVVVESDDGAGFAHSVGLWENFGHPEVLVFGLPGEVARELIEQVADEVDVGKQFLDGTKHQDLLANYPVRFVAVPRDRYGGVFATAVWAYEGDEFPAVQLVWPDKQGRWPWDPGVREGFRDAQPVLGSEHGGS